MHHGFAPGLSILFTNEIRGTEFALQEDQDCPVEHTQSSLYFYGKVNVSWCIYNIDCIFLFQAILYRPGGTWERVEHVVVTLDFIGLGVAVLASDVA